MDQKAIIVMTVRFMRLAMSMIPEGSVLMVRYREVEDEFMAGGTWILRDTNGSVQLVCASH